MIKGKILFIVSLLIALVLTAAAALTGFVGGQLLEDQVAATMVAYDWNVIKIAITAVLGALMLLATLPNVITARQVCRMYNVSRKYAKWSAVTIILGLLLVAACGGSIAYVAYALNSFPAGIMALIQKMALDYVGLNINVQTLQIACGVVIFLFFLLTFLPLMVSLRMRDSVSAMLRKKRAYSDDEEE